MLSYLVHFQVKEADIKRQFQESLKNESKRFKTGCEGIAARPKSDQKEMLRKLKEEQTRREATLYQQYTDTVAAVWEHQNVSRFGRTSSGTKFLRCVVTMYMKNYLH